MWKPVDTEFSVPRCPVSVVNVSGWGTEFIRAMLEALNCVVVVHHIGTPADFIKVIEQGENAPRYMIIMGHGTKDGLHFGDYGVPVDTSMLHNDLMPPEAICEHTKLPGCTVFSFSCYGGNKAMAEAFLAGDVSAYIGCRTGPDTTAMALFLFHFLFGVLSKQLPDHDAWHRAVAATDHEDIYQFSFFHADGAEERFGE
ncbi:MAG: hypothetical protein JO316_01235 [Abitibacteriaceae bacterium]|nr:hypothetical protein [Abditibacteriaceae bacterium]